MNYYLIGFVVLGLIVSIGLIVKFKIVQIKIKLPEISFKSPALFIIITITAVIFLGTSIYCYSLYSHISTEVISLNDKLNEKNDRIEALTNQNIKAVKENMRNTLALGFYMDHACIVTSTGQKYHRYGCSHIENSDFWIYNTEAAEQKGYTPCSDCWTDIYLSEYL